MKDKVDFLPADNFFSIWYCYFMCVFAGMPKLPKIIKFAISLQYLKKEVSDEVDFFAWSLILWLIMYMAKHSQITQSIKFAIFLQ